MIGKKLAILPLSFVLLVLSQPCAMAFADIFELDDSVEQANLIVIDDTKRQQHTLHSHEDEDWFKFYALGDKGYDISLSPVGRHIDVAFELYEPDGVTLIEQVNKSFEGKNEFLKWSPSSDDFYYLKVIDTAPNSDTCRSEIQYELQIGGTAPSFDGYVSGKVIDALSGQPIKYAIIYACGNQNAPTPSFEDGSYNLFSKEGLCELTAKVKDGAYKPLTCHLQIPELFPIIRNMPLLPSGQNVPAPSPSKTVYQHGEQLRVEFQSVGLPPQSCIRYYFGIAYPDGRFFIITQLNRFELFDWIYLPQWTGQQNVIIDKQIDNDMPRGEYLLYILRMPEGIDDPINNLDKGELNVSSFRIEE